MSVANSKHFLLVPFPIWGHTRPLCGLAANLLHLDANIHITLLIPGVLTGHVNRELARYDLVSQQDRFHIVYSRSKPKASGGFVGWVESGEWMESSIGSLADVYESLLKCEPISDGLSGQVVAPFDVAPTVALIDVAMSAPAISHCRMVERKLGMECALCMFAPFSGPYNIWCMTAESTDQDGQPSYYERVQKILADPADHFQQLSDQYIMHNEDRINAPGLAPFHVYETCPNQPDAFLSLMGPIHQSFPQWNGFIHTWPAFMSKEYQAHSDAKGIPVLQIGSQLPPLSEADKQFTGDENSDDLRRFMETALAADGEHSVLYISFGTILFPPALHQMKTLLGTMNAQRIRFLLVKGHAPDDMLAVYEEAVKASAGRGILTPWVQQYAVLAHKATGCFLTHGGSNSVLEAIRMKVPMAFWPASGDQPFTSNALTHLFKVGRELLQVRNGYNVGRKTALGSLVVGTEEAMSLEFTNVIGGILRGELGFELRRSIQSLSEEVVKDAAPGGWSYRALQRLAAM